jgi:hypothetical protein
MRRIFDFWVNRSGLDWLIVAVAAALFAKWGAITLLPQTGAEVLLQTVSSIAVGMIGLGSVTATLIITTTPSTKIHQAMQDTGKELIDQIFGCIFAFIFCIILLIFPFFKTDWMSYDIANWIFSLTLILMILRSLRLLALLRLFLLLIV